MLERYHASPPCPGPRRVAPGPRGRPAAGEVGRATSLPEWLTVLLTFVIVVAPLVAWALVIPPYGSPDENDHVRNSVAVVSGTPIVAVPTDEPWSPDVAEQLRGGAELAGTDPELAVRFEFDPPVVQIGPSGTATARVTVSADPPAPGQDASRSITVTAREGSRAFETPVTFVQTTSVRVEDPPAE